VTAAAVDPRGASRAAPNSVLATAGVEASEGRPACSPITPDLSGGKSHTEN
jgi:hypothetical protein